MTQDAPPFTAREKMRCAQRESGKRRSAYPRWVREGRMKQSAADEEIALMDEIARDYGARATAIEADLPIGADADQVAKSFVGQLQPSILSNMTAHSRAVLEIWIAGLIRRERERQQKRVEAANG